MFIDPHVHLRDFNQQHKETVKHGLEVARDVGVDAVFDMPNTDPPLISKETLRDRLQRAKEANVPEVLYGIYLGLTAHDEQVKRAVSLARQYHEVVGLKLYAGHSVGNLGVVQPEEQQRIYALLQAEGYHKVLAVHAEKESCMEHRLWNPQSPISHCYARPEEAEIESVQDQIAFARRAGFTGKLHIAHISSPQAVDLVAAAKQRGLDISCGVCPHHLLYDWHQMVNEQGLLWKMNPPLRSPTARQKLLNHLRAGNIDWIETDHAPHTLQEKVKHPYMSGVPGLPWWPAFAEYLRSNQFTEQQIERFTFSNAARRFGLDIRRAQRQTTDRTQDYPFNPYETLEAKIRKQEE